MKYIEKLPKQNSFKWVDNEVEKNFKKIKKIIRSCKTYEQLFVANKMVYIFSTNINLESKNKIRQAELSLNLEDLLYAKNKLMVING